MCQPKFQGTLNFLGSSRGVLMRVGVAALGPASAQRRTEHLRTEMVPREGASHGFMATGVGSVTLSNLLHLSEIQCPHLQDSDDSGAYAQVAMDTRSGSMFLTVHSDRCRNNFKCYGSVWKLTLNHLPTGARTAPGLALAFSTAANTGPASLPPKPCWPCSFPALSLHMFKP